MADKNFDDIAVHFATNIYQSLKGKVRLAVLRRDLYAHVPMLQHKRLRILDAGGGLGILSAELALQGHQILYCDISATMLAEAQQRYAALAIPQNAQVVAPQWCHESVQSLLQRDCDFDLILFHAVLEWLEQPRAVLGQILDAMGSQTYLSLLFYNQHSLVFRNLLRGNFLRAMQPQQAGEKGSLTPTNPLNPDDVKHWITTHNKVVCCESGVRVFSDYAEKPRIAQRTEQQIIDTELMFSQHPAFVSMGRYSHLIVHSDAINEESVAL